MIIVGSEDKNKIIHKHLSYPIHFYVHAVPHVFVLAVLVAVPSLMRFSVYITHTDINNGINMHFRNIKKR